MVIHLRLHRIMDRIHRLILMIPATPDLMDLDLTRDSHRRRIRINIRAIRHRRRKISSTSSRARTRIKATDPLNTATK